MGKRLDEIAARHRPIVDDLHQKSTYPPPPVKLTCRWCSMPGPRTRWPCDAAVLLMHIARREQVQEPGTET